MFERVIQDLDAYSEKRLNGESVPAHLLLFGHVSCDDLGHRGLNPSRRNRLIRSKALARHAHRCPTHTFS